MSTSLRLGWLRLIVVLGLLAPVTPQPARAEPVGGQIGNGTPGSCTRLAVENAVEAGGVYTFACGPNPHTIVISPQITVSTTTTLIAGMTGQVTLSGNDANRIFEVTGAGTLTLERLVLTKGDANNGDGGAI
jgi:hypothetical protein